MAISLIRWNDQKPVPWRNGLGVTREIDSGYHPDGRMLWTISLTTVDRDVPFSEYTGYQRTFMMTEGEGVTLDFGTHGKAELDHPFVPAVFDGAWPTTATLCGGPIAVLNVVVAQDAKTSTVDVLPLSGERGFTSDGLTYVHVLSGKVVCGGDTLAMGDTLRLDGNDTRCNLNSESDRAMVYRVDIG